MRSRFREDAKAVHPAARTSPSAEWKALRADLFPALRAGLTTTVATRLTEVKNRFQTNVHVASRLPKIKVNIDAISLPRGRKSGPSGPKNIAFGRVERASRRSFPGTTCRAHNYRRYATHTSQKPIPD